MPSASGRVSLWDIVEAASQVAVEVGAARRYGVGGPPPPGQAGSPGEPVEEARGGGVFRVLLPARGGGLRGLLWRGPFRAGGFGGVFGVDASSRRLEGSLVRVYVYGGGVSYFDGGLLLASYPDIGVYHYAPVDGGPAACVASPLQPSGVPRWVATAPLVDPEAVARAVPGAPRGLRGVGYWGAYDPRVAVEENRELLENELVGLVSREASPGEVVAVDGTLYMTPGLLTHLDALSRAGLRGTVTVSTVLRLAYALSYLHNTLRRVELVRAAVQRGLHVVGVVKRVHTSRLLASALEASGGAAGAYDVEIVEYHASRLLGGGYGYAALGPIIAVLDFNTAARLLDNILGGVASNIAAHQDAFREGAWGPRSIAQLYAELRRAGYAAKRMYYVYLRLPHTQPAVLRFEVPENGELLTVGGPGDYRVDGSAVGRVAAGDLELVGWLVEELTAPRPGRPVLPEPLAAADAVSRRASRASARVWFDVLAPVASFTYETLLAVASGDAGVAG